MNFFRLLFPVACLLSLASCSTVTPDHVRDRAAATDTSTPAGMAQANNGWLGYRTIDGITYGTITEHKRQEYNTLIADYRIQFRETWKVDLFPDSGLTPYQINGKACWLIDLEHVKHLILLKQWARNQRPVDSIWRKAVEKITP